MSLVSTLASLRALQRLGKGALAAALPDGQEFAALLHDLSFVERAVLALVGDDAVQALVLGLLEAATNRSLTWQDADELGRQLATLLPPPDLRVGGRRIIRQPAWVLLMRALARMLRQALIGAGVLVEAPAAEKEPDTVVEEVTDAG